MNAIYNLIKAYIIMGWEKLLYNLWITHIKLKVKIKFEKSNIKYFIKKSHVQNITILLNKNEIIYNLP